MSKTLYSIGQISEICDINAKVLRYYDCIDLLKPQYKNPETSYRYYCKNQIFTIFLIKKLQMLGFSLQEIKKLISVEDTDLYVKEVNKKIQSLRKKIDMMKKIYMEGLMLINKLEMKQERLDYFEIKNQNEGDLCIDEQIRANHIRIESISERDVLYTRKTMKDYNNIEISIGPWFEIYKIAEKRVLPVTGSIILTYHTVNPLEQFYKSTCELEVMLPVSKGNQQFEDIKTFGGFNAAVTLHIGEYSNIYATHLKVLQWLEENGLKLNGNISEEYIISPIDLNSGCGYITKIIAPVAPVK